MKKIMTLLLMVTVWICATMVSCGSDGTAVEEPEQRYIIEGVWKYEDEESDHRIKFSYGTVNNYFKSNWLGSVQNGKALSYTKYSDTQGAITYNRIIIVNYRFISEDSLSCYIITKEEQTEDMIFVRDSEDWGHWSTIL